MAAEEPRDLVTRKEDGTLTKETVKRAMKAFRRRLKLTRLDDESRLGHDPMSNGERSTITGITPPEHYPKEVWEELAQLGRLLKLEQGIYEIIEL